MNFKENHKTICAGLLELFQVDEGIDTKDIENLKLHKSQNYALGPVYAFNYKGKHYYGVDDYSLGDDSELVRDILLDINHLLKGRIMKNPTPQSDNAKYATGLDGIEYYLWESPLL